MGLICMLLLIKCNFCFLLFEFFFDLYNFPVCIFCNFAYFADFSHSFVSSFRCDITDASMHHVGCMSSLESLDVENTKITDQGLAHLVDLPRLVSLNIAACVGVTDSGLHLVSMMRTLETLNLSRTKVTETGMSHLRGLPDLRELDLNGCFEIDDFAMHFIASFPRLEVINISHSRVTDTGLADLLKSKSLKRLKCVSALIKDDRSDWNGRRLRIISSSAPTILSTTPFSTNDQSDSDSERSSFLQNPSTPSSSSSLSSSSSTSSSSSCTTPSF